MLADYHFIFYIFKYSQCRNLCPRALGSRGDNKFATLIIIAVISINALSPSVLSLFFSHYYRYAVCAKAPSLCGTVSRAGR